MENQCDENCKKCVSCIIKRTKDAKQIKNLQDISHDILDQAIDKAKTELLSFIEEFTIHHKNDISNNDNSNNDISNNDISNNDNSNNSNNDTSNNSNNDTSNKSKKRKLCCIESLVDTRLDLLLEWENY